MAAEDGRFARAEVLLGAAALERLHRSRVAVFGLGGVGSWCAEALTRSGVGHLLLVDEDTVSQSNINRQLPALTSTIGRPKAVVMAERLREINPALCAVPETSRYEAKTREYFALSEYDYVVDAIDLVSCKIDLIETALRLRVPVVAALGAGNKRDAARLCLADLADTSGCPLARVMRRELRRRGIVNLPVVYSPEECAAPQTAADEPPPPGRRSVPGSLVWVTATAGMLLAQHVVLALTQENTEPFSASR